MLKTSVPEVGMLVGSLNKQAEGLQDAAQMKQSGKPAETDEAVRQMLQRASDLVRASGALGEQRNSIALAVLSRAILENFILMLWVQVAADNAATLKQMAVAELVRAAKVNFEKGKARIVDRQNGEDATAKFLQSERFKNLPKRVSIETRAKEAGVEDLYTVFYRFMSLDIHGHNFLQGNEKTDDVTVMHLQGIGALALASGHVGVRWLIHRQRTDNETLRVMLGFELDETPTTR